MEDTASYEMDFWKQTLCLNNKAHPSYLMAYYFLDFFTPCDRVLLSPKVCFITFPVSADFGCEQIKKSETIDVQTLKNEVSIDLTPQP
jgi:hypothetical protein